MKIIKFIKIEKAIFIISIIFLSLIYGYISHEFKIFPHNFFQEAVSQLKKYTGKSQPHYLYKAFYKRYGAKKFDQNYKDNGITLLSTYWGKNKKQPGVKLIDSNGNVLHTWYIDRDDLCEKWGKDRRELWQGLFIHGSYLYPNGDLLFNFEHVGILKVDSCGNIVWKSDYTAHHSIERDDEDNFWICSHELISKIDTSNIKELMNQYPGLKAPLIVDHVLKISPEGKILRKINVLKIIYKNNLQYLIPRISKRNSMDVMHLNDVESLDKRIANEYPLFKSGDIVISLKYLHLILVIDPKSEKLKWHSALINRGTVTPFIEQHDPDFTGKGWITLFDNRQDNTPRGTMLGGSRIIGIRPHTGEVKVIFPKNNSETFYTQVGGKMQVLKNGNLLITECNTGRVFEINKKGKVIWEWINKPDKNNMVAEVMEGTRYPYTPEQVSKWECSISK